MVWLTLMYKCPRRSVEEKTKKRKLKRLIAEIPIEIHCEIKSIAASQNLTIRQFVFRAIVEKIKRERKL